MKKVDVSVAIICLACLIMLFMSGGSSLAMAEEAPHLTAEQAIAAARRNAKPGSSFTILWKIIANADTRRIGDQALEPAADGGFMHVEDAGNLEKRLAIEEVGGEEEAVFRRKGLEHAGNGVGKVREFGGDDSSDC